MATTVRAIINDLGGPTVVAKTVELHPSAAPLTSNAVQQWLVSKRIPRGRWLDLIQAFPDRISADKLRAAERVAA